MRKIRVQMPQGTGSVSVAGHEYTANGEGVVTVDHAEHVGPLVGLGGVELGDDGEPGGQTSGLMGSTRFPATIDLPGDREPLTLGDVVRETHARSTVSVDEWNNLPAAIRDILIGFRIAELRGDMDRGDGELAAENADLRERIDNHERTIDDLQSRIQELQAGAGGTGSGTGETSSSEAPQKPDFAEMTKAKINEWLSANGGEPIASGDHKSHVDAGEARWAQLHPAA